MKRFDLIKPIIGSFLLALLVFAFSCSPKVKSNAGSKFNTVQNIPPKIEQWEKSIAAFEQQDKENPPKKGSILFVGSSSMVFWKDLDSYFPGKYIINRGFGGSQTDEVHYYAFRILFPYQPKQVVVYVGDNDVNAGKSPEKVFNDLKDFFEDIRTQLPKTKITYISIKPSPSRWDKMDKFTKTNALVENYLKTINNASYVDVVKPMLLENGRPNPAYFLSDSLHMTPAGYDVWAKALAPHLE